jgi:SAM-dependent methyltransferase
VESGGGARCSLRAEESTLVFERSQIAGLLPFTSCVRCASAMVSAMSQWSSSDTSMNFYRYLRIAAIYDLLDLPFEFGRYRTLRPQLFDGLRGHVLDAGVGTGHNFLVYPCNSNVIGIDISPAMLARAERRRSRSPAASIALHQMDVTHMAFPDHSFDAAVASSVLCPAR